MIDKENDIKSIKLDSLRRCKGWLGIYKRICKFKNPCQIEIIGLGVIHFKLLRQF